MIEVKGPNGIVARMLADSIYEGGTARMQSYELEYMRFFHSEVMTHRILSKNAASSRAIPYARAADLVTSNPAIPVHWGINQAGMQAKEQFDELTAQGAQGVWLAARDAVLSHCNVLNDMKLHKQVNTRLIEPWVMIKVVLSGTDFENLWWLRDDEDAQPEFQALVKCMREAQALSVPTVLKTGEWHLPYITSKRDQLGALEYFSNDTKISLADAIKLSASCCAQVSYRKLDESVAKGDAVYQRLVGAKKKHSSPFEHQATPVATPVLDTGVFDPAGWEQGVTHVDSCGEFWSGNLRGWIQHRKLIAGDHIRG